MGLLDSFAKNALGGMLGGSASKQDPATMLAGMLGEAGGLEGMMDRFQSAGLGDHFASWVSTGENMQVDANELQRALGDEAMQRLTSQLGGGANSVLPLMAQFLPLVIDKLTPQGVIDNNIPSGSQIQSALMGAISSSLGGLGGLAGLLGKK